MSVIACLEHPSVLASNAHAREKAGNMGFPEHHRTIDATPPDGRSRRVGASQTTNLADLLERVLDKGIVIAGDITVSLGEVELLNIKVRLLIASIDKAQEIGINWWQSDPALSSHARKLEQENRLLHERLERLEHQLAVPAQREDQPALQSRQHEPASPEPPPPTNQGTAQPTAHPPN